MGASAGDLPTEAGWHPPGGEVSAELGARADAARNFRRTGGRFGRSAEPHWVLQARTSYFRDEYVHGNVIAALGGELVLRSRGLADAARELYGMRVIVPYIVYGNLLVPGQELGLHTDVPAVRGADRTEFPLWFLVVMRHSGLFEQWRIPVATAVAFVGECSGGESDSPRWTLAAPSTDRSGLRFCRDVRRRHDLPRSRQGVGRRCGCAFGQPWEKDATPEQRGSPMGATDEYE